MKTLAPQRQSEQTYRHAKAAPSVSRDAMLAGIDPAADLRFAA